MVIFTRNFTFLTLNTSWENDISTGRGTNTLVPIVLKPHYLICCLKNFAYFYRILIGWFQTASIKTNSFNPHKRNKKYLKVYLLIPFSQHVDILCWLLWIFNQFCLGLYVAQPHCNCSCQIIYKWHSHTFSYRYGIFVVLFHICSFGVFWKFGIYS